MVSIPADGLTDIRQTFGRLAYTHKTHEKETEIKRSQAFAIKVTNLAVISVTAAAALISPLVGSASVAWLAFVAALVGLVFSAFQLSFDPSRDAMLQTMAAKSYLSLRNEYRRLLVDAESGTGTVEDIYQRRDAFGRELAQLDRAAPPTSKKAYEEARNSLKGSEELTFTEEEYHHLL